ncbi:gap junction protein alpha 4 [Nothobranchius furzeri]|uniref:Gap junction protein n=2 Tax=Nothobranchius furzeri TaxID=105023 RepID=A0A1A7ZLB5_NOTFU|nr:gap junction protein alpha 4 [Nothobranchius furzeri]KAF7203495.1 gap junction alpha-6 protein-like [Nothobranchius furzeri]
MSRADWSFLEHLLEEGQEYSTAIGRVWLTVLFLFRMLVLGTAAESAWDDEQADFECNTKQPGCTAVCYDRAFPISHFRYFVLQVIFVSTPTIFYFGYVAVGARNVLRDTEDTDGNDGRKTGVTDSGFKEKEKDKTGENGINSTKSFSEAPKLKGRLLGAYAFSILVKVLLEAGFIAGLWFLYDGFFIAAKFECTGFPCPHTVDCFVSRPTEKTIFTIYTQVIAAISLLLNIVELLHLLMLAVSLRLKKRNYLPRFEPVPSEQHMEASQAYSTGRLGESSLPSNPCESYADSTTEVNWEPGEVGDNLLPSYVNCTQDIRKTNKHFQQTGKNLNSSFNWQQKDYV